MLGIYAKKSGQLTFTKEQETAKDVDDLLYQKNVICHSEKTHTLTSLRSEGKNLIHKKIFSKTIESEFDDYWASFIAMWTLWGRP